MRAEVKERERKAVEADLERQVRFASLLMPRPVARLFDRVRRILWRDKQAIDRLVCGCLYGCVWQVGAWAARKDLRGLLASLPQIWPAATVRNTPA